MMGEEKETEKEKEEKAAKEGVRKGHARHGDRTILRRMVKEM
jgi:hypothetical protein